MKKVFKEKLVESFDQNLFKSWSSIYKNCAELIYAIILSGWKKLDEQNWLFQFEMWNKVGRKCSWTNYSEHVLGKGFSVMIRSQTSEFH